MIKTIPQVMLFHIGTSLITWKSKKHPIVTISSIEGLYIVVTSTTCNAILIRILLGGHEHEEKEQTPIYCDNNSVIALYKNHMFHHKSKHVDTHFHFM